MSEAYIVAATRTAGGRLSGWHPVDLAAQVLDGFIAEGLRAATTEQRSAS